MIFFSVQLFILLLAMGLIAGWEDEEKLLMYTQIILFSWPTWYQIRNFCAKMVMFAVCEDSKTTAGPEMSPFRVYYEFLFVSTQSSSKRSSYMQIYNAFLLIQPDTDSVIPCEQSAWERLCCLNSLHTLQLCACLLSSLATLSRELKCGIFQSLLLKCQIQRFPK